MSTLNVALDARGGPRLGVSVPRGCLLSNGGYSVLLTAAGTGVSTLDGVALTAWAPDPVEDGQGYFVYLREPALGAVWSVGHQPVQRHAERYQAVWHPGRFEIVRVDHDLESRLEVCVATDAPLEIRRLTLTNRSGRARHVEVTSFAEVALQAAPARAAHPEFSRLFVQTEFVPEVGALLARRRPRAPGERHPWLFHALVEGGDLEHETDRARFVGRGRSRALPHALAVPGSLAGATGNVLDPIVSLRRTVELEPEGSACITFLLGGAPERESALAAVERWTAPRRIAEAFARAELRERDLLSRLGLAEERAAEYHSLAAAMLYGHPGLRVLTGAAPTGALGGFDPGRYGLDGDRALLLLHAGRAENVPRLGRWVRAYRYWRAAGVPCEMLLLCDAPETVPSDFFARDGETHRVCTYAEVEAGDLAALSRLARLVVPPEPAEALMVDSDPQASLNGAGSRPQPVGPRPPAAPMPVEPLAGFNGYGGFSADGREYVIRLDRLPDGALLRPPRPWVNVIANPRFGCLVSETGAGTTWSGNSREHRLTPWSNDPLLDPHDEAYYLRDEETGEVWSAFAGPIPGAGGYEMRHGFGSSTCRHREGDLEHEATVFVPREDTLKVVRLRLTAHGRPRRLALVGYQRLVLGTRPEESAGFVTTARDEVTGALLARNPAAAGGQERVAFAAAVPTAGAGEIRATCDREAFLGRYGSPERPHALEPPGEFDGRTGTGLDPCFALAVPLTVPAGASVECSFLLGDAESVDAARALIERYRAPGAIGRALAEVGAFWSELLDGVRIETPMPALDRVVNGWLGYQTLACRLWGRTAFYQSGGAYGFRDQLQDATAMAWFDPRLLRDQILLHAAHQFVEGDVLHWWHPPLSRGIRTRFADDLLWLPWATADYVRVTGDRSILDEACAYLVARPLAAGEDEAYLEPARSDETGDLYEHCCRAIDRARAFGVHGLPLFGTGDWNDGMNRVGREGRGESVWMGFFLHAVLGDFLPLCELRGDGERRDRYRPERERLRAALEGQAWDGEWYQRGTYDNGAPLGSRYSDECRIDALVQAWSVISGAAAPERAERALASVERHLVSTEDGLIRLLTPPFEHTPHDPGYIKGYVPGVRENGGQYTHAALWVVRAMAELGWNERAAHLLEMLSPAERAQTPERVARYQVEPYVVAADVYGAPPHVGRGGWTWYTGSAGWMLRVALESVLGLRIEGGEALVVKPCVPGDWPGYRVRLRVPGRDATLDVVARRGEAGAGFQVCLDGRPVPVAEGLARVPITAGRAHEIEIALG